MKFYTNILQWGNSLLLREVVNGERVCRKVRYSPTLYAPVNSPTEWKTLKGQYVTPVQHNTIKEAKEWVENYKNQPELVHGSTMYSYNYIADEYPNRINYDVEQILIVTIDIEVECENGFPSPEEAVEPLLSITVKNHTSKKFVVWGVGKFQNDRDDVTYVECSDELYLIKEFLSFWESHQPDIITGWNTEFFDIPYLCNRIEKLCGEDEVKRLSPWRSVFSREVFKMGRKHQVFDIQGVSHLDYFDLYRKFTYTAQESYRLDHIAFVELGDRKDGNPYETFSEWYQKDFQSFIEYNIMDVEIVDRLEDKMKLIELLWTMAYDAKVNYMDVLGSTKYWDILIYNYLREKNIVIPQKKHNSKAEKFEGAYVKDPQVGMHKWVMSFDLNSLYPHLIMQYNISTETLVAQEKVPNMSVDKLLNKEVDTSILKGVTLTPNGALFKTNKQGFLPELMQSMYNDRSKFKKLMLEAQQDYENTKDPKLLKDISKYNNIQMAKKISLNSVYGAIGNAYFRYYDLLVAEAITTSGQLAIRWIERAVNQYLNKLLKTDNKDYVIASDTDSVYVVFDELVNKVYSNGENTEKIVAFLDSVAKNKIEPFMDKSYQELHQYVNSYEQKMQMAREVIADKGIWTAKKRYVLNVHNSEGVQYKQAKLKVMGLEVVKSSTPAPVRAKLKEALSIIMNGNEKELNTFIQTFREEFMNLSPEEIAYPRSVNGLDKFADTNQMFAKGAPIHCKGAILYNHLIKKNKLGRKYPYIQEGDKIKFINLKQPNLYQCSAFSFITNLPKELDLHKMIDYDTQFEKSFIDPLNVIVSTIGWLVDKSYGTQGSLEDFFS
jgi:DNA polymerase elongation subunit (family B)